MCVLSTSRLIYIINSLWMYCNPTVMAHNCRQLLYSVLILMICIIHHLMQIVRRQTCFNIYRFLLFTVSRSE